MASLDWSQWDPFPLPYSHLSMAYLFSCAPRRETMTLEPTMVVRWQVLRGHRPPIPDCELVTGPNSNPLCQ
jgi:hypothetical protein